MNWSKPKLLSPLPQRSPWKIDLKKYILYLIFPAILIAGSKQLSAQSPVLTLEDAVKTGLEQNYSIKILRNQEIIAGNNMTRGAAGMLPVVTGTGTLGYAINNTEQKFFNGDTRGAPNAATFRTGLGVDVGWTAFDGFRMYVERDRLATVERQSKVQTTLQIQGLAADIAFAYYNIVQLVRSRENLRYAVGLDRDLYDLVKRKKIIGTVTGLELLQSQSRLTADSTRLVQLEADIQRAQMAFNDLLNVPAETRFEVDTTLAVAALPGLDELVNAAKQANPAVSLAKLNREIANLRTKDLEGTFLPEVTLQGSYNFAFQRNQVGFLLSNRSLGPSVGLTARYTIYDGKNRLRNLDNARIAETNAALQEEELLTDLESRIHTRYADYQAILQQRGLEEINLKVALDQANLARELYRLGRITNFEVREATLQEIQARDRMIAAWFRLKQAEIDLLDLAGMTLMR